jgi:hypothetical protein
MKNFNAIRFLYPDAIFSMVDDDVKQITWVGQEYPIPTAKALKDAIKAYEDAEAQALADKEAAKAALLERLGITAEEASLLLS